MRGIIGLIAFIFLLKINILSAQSNAAYSTNEEVDVGLINVEDSTDFSDTIPLKDAQEAEFSVYPSPAENDINIQFEMTQATKIRMSNIIGNVLYETTISPNIRLYSTTLNVSNLPKGLYFITIDDGANPQTKRFVKQ